MKLPCAKASMSTPRASIHKAAGVLPAHSGAAHHSFVISHKGLAPKYDSRRLQAKRHPLIGDIEYGDHEISKQDLVVARAEIVDAILRLRKSDSQLSLDENSICYGSPKMEIGLHIIDPYRDDKGGINIAVRVSRDKYAFLIPMEDEKINFALIKSMNGIEWMGSFLKKAAALVLESHKHSRDGVRASKRIDASITLNDVELLTSWLDRHLGEDGDKGRAERSQRPVIEEVAPVNLVIILDAIVDGDSYSGKYRAAMDTLRATKGLERDSAAELAFKWKLYADGTRCVSPRHWDGYDAVNRVRLHDLFDAIEKARSKSAISEMDSILQFAPKVVSATFHNWIAGPWANGQMETHAELIQRLGVLPDVVKRWSAFWYKEGSKRGWPLRSTKIVGTGVRTKLQKGAIQSESRWNIQQAKMMELVLAEIKQMRRRGIEITPVAVIEALHDAPRYIIHALQNNVMDARSDMPRMSKSLSARVLALGSEQTLFMGWEKFWRAHIENLGWKEKPCGRGREPDIDAARKYALECSPRWKFTEYVRWFERYVELIPAARIFYLLLHEIVDLDVVAEMEFSNPDLKVPKQRRGMAEVLAYLDEIMYADADSSGEELNLNSITQWIRNFEEFAVEMGIARAIRPRKEAHQRSVDGRKKFEKKEEIFREVGSMSLDEGDRAKELHRRLLELGNIVDGAVVENIIAGVNGEPRRPRTHVTVPGYSNNLSKVEKRIVELAQMYGFRVKAKDASSELNIDSHKAVARVELLCAQFERDGVSSEEAAEIYRQDEMLNDLLGDRADIITSIMVKAKDGVDQEAVPKGTKYNKSLEGIIKEETASAWFDRWWRVFRILREGELSSIAAVDKGNL